MLIVAFAVGCASDQAFRYYSAERFPARDPGTVEVLNSAPTRPFTVIADFQIRNASEERLRREAAKIGADAVIVTHLGGFYQRSEKWAGEDRLKGTRTRLVGSAIKFED